MKNISLIIVAAIVMLLTSCHYPGYLEQQKAIPKFEWSSNFKPLFDFEVKDTNSLYNIFIVVRHFDTYHFNNMWINLTSVAPGDTAISQKINVKLGDNKRWLGSEMDDIVEHRILVTKSPIKLQKGNYMFVLQNAMREDPLLGVLNVGVRVEKAED